MYIYSRPEQSKPKKVNEAVEIEMKTFQFDNIYRSKTFTKCMNEKFDVTDTKTRKVLLAVNEADQNNVMTSLANKLYDNIINKVDDIDFGTIPASKGDLTKIENYDKLQDCVNIITDILNNYHQSTAPIDTVSLAMQNLIDRKDMFEKAYMINVEMPIIIYNTMALSIVSAVSYMIASCVEFVKSSDTEGFDIAINKVGVTKTADVLLFKDLEKFNRICATGEFDKSMDYVINKNAKNFAALVAYDVGSVALVLGILLTIIPLIRELIFFFYYSRTRVSEYFDMQSTLLTMNAYNIENNLTRDVKDKKQVVAKQKKMAELFKKISNKLAVNVKTTDSKASKEAAKEDKDKVKIDDIMKSMPDSANSVLF